MAGGRDRCDARALAGVSGDLVLFLIITTAHVFLLSKVSRLEVSGLVTNLFVLLFLAISQVGGKEVQAQCSKVDIRIVDGNKTAKSMPRIPYFGIVDRVSRMNASVQNHNTASTLQHGYHVA